MLLHVTKRRLAMPTPVSERVQKRREALRAAGLRPVQIWVPDTRRPGFTAECRRQAALIAAADRRDADLSDFMDAALTDLDDWR
jgi:L-alanine-DL-glutamate epimerase-like enolase superfamily enzyme